MKKNKRPLLEKNITFRVKNETDNIIEKYAIRNEMSKSSWVRAIILKELERLEDSKNG